MRVVVGTLMLVLSVGCRGERGRHASGLDADAAVFGAGRPDAAAGAPSESDGGMDAAANTQRLPSDAPGTPDAAPMPAAADGGGMVHSSDAATAALPDAAAAPQMPTGRKPADPSAKTRALNLIASSPVSGARDVARTSWLRLEFDADLDPKQLAALVLDCGPNTPAYDVSALGARVLVLNPRAPLPAAAACVLRWPGSAFAAELPFGVAAGEDSAVLEYDRNDSTRLDPFPDDYYLADDASTRTGKRVDVRVPNVDLATRSLLESAIVPSRSLDGMSPLGPIVVQLPAALEPGTFPQTAAQSLDAFASMGLFDVDPASAQRGQRVPFDVVLRSANDPGGTPRQLLVVFPAQPLRPRGRYVFAVGNRVLAIPARPLAASPFLQRLLAGTARTPDEQRAQLPLTAALSALAQTSPPLHADDLALALSISVRSDDDIPSDLLSIRQQLAAAEPPRYFVRTAVSDDVAGSEIAAVVTGTFRALSFRNGDFLARDRSGRPVAVGSGDVDFVLALPKRALGASAPLIVYQHGQPGSAENEVPNIARGGLAAAGFAVIGFTDVANREIIANGDVVALYTQVLLTLLTQQALPDYMSLFTHAEQLALLRLIPSLGALDVLPLGAPDGRPDLDPSLALGFLGVSQGSTHGLGLLAFAPEIHAAALTVGAGRFGAVLVHQASEQLYPALSAVYSGLTLAQFYTAIALVQMAFDRQDPQNLARFLYAQKLPLGADARASVLMTEGLGDAFVPFYATRSAAFTLGLPQLAPQAEPVAFLSSAASPLTGNLTAATSGALFQYVPSGYPAAPATPGCAASGQNVGHYCPQTAPEALAQRLRFFESALAGVPTIVAP